MSQNSHFFKKAGDVVYDYNSNLVAAFKFADNLNDYTGNHNAVLSGTSSYEIAKVGKGVQLGVNSFLTLADDADFSFKDVAGDVAFTIPFWIKFNSFAAAVSIMSKRESSSSMEWQVFLTGGGDLIIDCFSGTVANYIRLNYSWNPSNDVWYHVVPSYGGGGVKEDFSLIIDGVDVTSFSTLSEVGSYSGMSNTGSDVSMGGRNYITPELGLDGVLNAPKIYKGEQFSIAKSQNLYDKESLGIDVLT